MSYQPSEVRTYRRVVTHIPWLDFRVGLDHKAQKPPRPPIADLAKRREGSRSRSQGSKSSHARKFVYGRFVLAVSMWYSAPVRRRDSSILTVSSLRKDGRGGGERSVGSRRAGFQTVAKRGNCERVKLGWASRNPGILAA